MKKLTLDPEALQVESFDVSRGGSLAHGTVRANDGRPGTFTQTLVETTTDPNQNCMCYSSDPCVNTHVTACGPDCI
ncbi:MAG TPA: hypothetical protein VFS20_25015 [Longimicrobium sp.]|nr:hypothetical protein [Longimicrobium sp.]